MSDNLEPSKYFVTPFQTKVDKPWGYEIIYSPAAAPTVGKILHVNAGKRLSLQYHDQKIETLCLTEGEAKITLSDTKGETIEIPMELNKGYYMQPGQIHRVTAISDITFIETSTPETGNTYRLEDDANRATETEETRQQERKL